MEVRTSNSKPPNAQSVPVLPVRDSIHFPQILNTVLVGRDLSVKALQKAAKGKRLVLVVGQKDVSVEDPKASDLYSVGTLSEVMQIMPMPDGSMRTVLRGIARHQSTRMSMKGGLLVSESFEIHERRTQGIAVDAMRRETLRVFERVAALGKNVPHEALENLPHIADAGHLADVITHHIDFSTKLKQEILEELDSERRLTKLLCGLGEELRVLELQADLRAKIDLQVGEVQREYYLREQLRLIHEELGDEDGAGEVGAELSAKIAACGMPLETEQRAFNELKRLERTPFSSPENGVIRTYLDWLIGLPWNVLTEDRLNLPEAGRSLARAHFGLEKVKERILDFLAVRQLNPWLRGPILCFIGPPGVGKTSIGRSIAQALGRKFLRVSLGGVRDEAEIRGHRRTYVGALPGRLIQGLKSCGSRNPVFMLDEIDKMGGNYHGDPTSALLEALDPEQNAHYSDHYIEAPFDLSSVMFIMTANVAENIPAALRDRMEMIHFPSYTEEEKLHIAKRFLLPRMKAEHGIGPKQLIGGSSVLKLLIRDYTMEAGVRELERRIATLCRKSARMIAEDGLDVRIDAELARTMLGHAPFRRPQRHNRSEVGSATGLVVTEIGGDLVTIEASLMPPFDEPSVRLTGSLGAVMQESAWAAFTYVRSRQEDFNASQPFHFDVHIHVPEGAVPKDGPSAGITIAIALISAYTGQTVRSDVAMTGEITLHGRVLGVGGVREKAMAAHRAGIRHLIVPEENLSDLDDLPQSARSQLSIHPIAHISDAVPFALGEG